MDKYAIVTGAANGMGETIATRLSQEGYHIVAVDINAEGLDRLEEEIESEKILKYAADISDSNFANKLKKELSEKNIELLVNNAGIRYPKSILDETNEELDKTLAVNLKAPFYLIREIGSLMSDNGRGLIVNIASVAGQRGFKNRASYCASKGGLISLTQAAAVDLADKGVSIVAICPGFINTTMSVEEADSLAAQHVPMGRSGTATDIAQVVFDLTKWDVTTGTTITIDGGLIGGFKK